MRLNEAIERNKGIGPGFHFLRHALSVLIVAWHCRQVVYWQHSAQILAARGITDAGAAAEASQYGPVHYTMQDLTRPAIPALVGMFFALSGFLIAGSALRTRKVSKFMANRVLRIFPALVVETLLSAFLLGAIFTRLSLSEYFTSPELFRYFGNMIGWIYFYLPGVFDNNPLPRVVNGQLWTLPSEFYCYITMFFVLGSGLIYRNRTLLVLGSLGLLLMLGLFAYDPQSFNPKHQNFYTNWYIVVLFWFGVIFFTNADLVPLKRSLFIAAIGLYWVTIFYTTAVPLSGVFLTYCMIYIGFVRFQWWDKLVKSDYSYGLFLYHFPILQAIMQIAGPHMRALPLSVQFVLVFAIGLPCTLAFAALSWRFVEKPALSLRTIFARTPAVDTGSAAAPSAATAPETP